jgi:hypothetical protein
LQLWLFLWRGNARHGPKFRRALRGAAHRACVP